MKVIVAEKSGFCQGVKNAISTAETILAAEPGPIYSLGPIIHNKEVVGQLKKAGLIMANSVEQIQTGTVIIRSHGAVPEHIAELKQRGLKIVDATCVLVKRLQTIAKELQKADYKVVIIGDENHPEIQAVMGCARDVIVVADEKHLHKLPKNTKLGVVCQTTESPDHVSAMLGAIAKMGFRELKVINTLCKEAVKRQKSAVKLCKQVDIMFVLGDLESANTRRLAELCKKYNKQTFHLQNWNELDKNTLSGKNIAGVTAGASTPEWIIARFVENLAAFDTGAP